MGSAVWLEISVGVVIVAVGVKVVPQWLIGLIHFCLLVEMKKTIRLL